MSKIDAIRIELEGQKNIIFQLNEIINNLVTVVETEKTRTDRVVQVLLNNLPQENLDKVISFSGVDCCGMRRDWFYWERRTLEDFLTYIIDP